MLSKRGTLTAVAPTLSVLRRHHAPCRLQIHSRVACSRPNRVWALGRHDSDRHAASLGEGEPVLCSSGCCIVDTPREKRASCPVGFRGAVLSSLRETVCRLRIRMRCAPCCPRPISWRSLATVPSFRAPVGLTTRFVGRCSVLSIACAHSCCDTHHAAQPMPTKDAVPFASPASLQRSFTLPNAGSACMRMGCGPVPWLLSGCGVQAK